jgi:hypothetical protein
MMWIELDSLVHDGLEVDWVSVKPSTPPRSAVHSTCAPSGRVELAQLSIVRRIRIGPLFRRLQKVVDVRSENRPNRMHGVVPIEAFAHQTRQRCLNRSRSAECHLVFYHHVKCGMRDEIRSSKRPLSVIGRGRLDPLRLRVSQPAFRIDSPPWIVLERHPTVRSEVRQLTDAAHLRRPHVDDLAGCMLPRCLVQPLFNRSLPQYFALGPLHVGDGQAAATPRSISDRGPAHQRTINKKESANKERQVMILYSIQD